MAVKIWAIFHWSRSELVFKAATLDWAEEKALIGVRS